MARLTAGSLLGLACCLLLGCGDPQLRQAHAALGAGRYDVAVSLYDDARTRLPAEDVPLDRVASAHRALAMQHVQGGDCDTARLQLHAAEAVSAPVLADHRALYECTAARGASDADLYDDLGRMAALGDTRVVVTRRRAQLALTLGRDRDADGHFAVLEKRQVLTWAERKTLLRLLLRLEEVDRALPYLEHVVAADPNRPLDRYTLAQIYEAKGRPRDARTVYERLARDYPQNPVTHLRLAEFLERVGDPVGARRARVTANRIRGIEPPPERNLRPLLRSKR